MKHGTKLRAGSLFAVAGFSLGCVATELEAPAKHPGHPSARPGKSTTSSALGAKRDSAVNPAGDGDATEGDHSGHGGQKPEPAGDSR